MTGFGAVQLRIYEIRDDVQSGRIAEAAGNRIAKNRIDGRHRIGSGIDAPFHPAQRPAHRTIGQIQDIRIDFLYIVDDLAAFEAPQPEIQLTERGRRRRGENQIDATDAQNQEKRHQVPQQESKQPERRAAEFPLRHVIHGNAAVIAPFDQPRHHPVQWLFCQLLRYDIGMRDGRHHHHLMAAFPESQGDIIIQIGRRYAVGAEIEGMDQNLHAFRDKRDSYRWR